MKLRHRFLEQREPSSTIDWTECVLFVTPPGRSAYHMEPGLVMSWRPGRIEYRQHDEVASLEAVTVADLVPPKLLDSYQLTEVFEAEVDETQPVFGDQLYGLIGKRRRSRESVRT